MRDTVTAEENTTPRAAVRGVRYRAMDLVGASVGLLLGWPVMLVAALVVRLTMGGPVLFRQVRLGRDEQPFTLLKLRTMNGARDPHGRLLPGATRLTRVGRWLRSLSIDELPQLWNVLRGDMSLVGPRPLHPHYLPYYSARERLRHQVRPGMTGYAQVNGRNSLSWDERLELDVQYVEGKSLLLDLRIVLCTVGKVVRRRDVGDRALQGSLADYRGAQQQARD